ncbi:O-antigen ligase family protein [Sulfobacillus thermosulfidooxidans]|uniref:O-antigen ligase family protein n=1 Tax=Sulfobacillus thermosulfidooxidans TaxID=28034 RepID=UPI000C717A68|nr:O-antigen ligase family protein [Sulfobacillus thermosulfidooxidans]
MRAEMTKIQEQIFAKTMWGPLTIVALGAVIAIRLGMVGAIIFFVGYIWLATLSLPLAAMLYILAAPFPIGMIFHHHKFYVADFMAIVLAIKLFLANVHKGFGGLVDTFLPKAFRLPLLFLLLLSVLSLGESLSRFGTVIKILEYIEFFVVMVAVFRNAGTDERIWNRYFTALFLAVSAVTVYGLYQFMFQLGPVYNIVDGHHVRATGFFGQPNVFGAFNDETFPLALALLTLGPRYLKKGWLAVATGLTALGAVLSYSRGSWVADAAAVFFMLVLVAVTKPKVVKTFAAYGIGIPILMFLAVFFLGKTDLSHTALFIGAHKNTIERLKTTVTALLNPQGHFDTDQRLLIWKAALQAIRQHPLLGVGLGNFHLFIQQHPPKGLAAVPPMAHDLYLEWGADLGVGGIVAALWLEWSWISKAVGIIRQKLPVLNEYGYAALMGAFGTAVAFIVHNWVDFLIDQGVIVPLLIALAFIAAQYEHFRNGSVS